MRVACPNCKAVFQLDETRVPDRGANVRCSRCHETFPVKKTSAADAPAAVPLPGGAAPSSAGTNSIPLPGASAPPKARPAPPATGATPGTGGIPLPAPAGAGSSPPLAPAPVAPPAAAPAMSFPAAPPASPFDDGPVTEAASPFDAGPPTATTPSPFGAEPFEPTASPFDSGSAPFAAASAGEAAGPLVPPPPPAGPAAAPLSFGEVDLSSDALEAPSGPPAGPASPFERGLAPAPPPPDPFDVAPRAAPPPPAAAAAAVAAPRTPPPPPGDAEDLEMLFGDAPPKAAAPAPPAPASSPPPPPSPAPARAGGYHVRRRSGKIFGPFQEEQIVEMLSKGELLGNEDVSTDGTDYTPIGAVAAFGAAVRKSAAQEPAPRPNAPVVFGDRMAAAKVVEGRKRRVRLPRGLKWVALGAAVVLVLAAGVGAGFTRYGFFFTRMLRRGDPAALASQIGQARTALARGDFTSERAALDHAARAVAADPGSSEAVMIHALAVAALDLEHGAPPEAVAQARRATEALQRGEKREVSTLAAALAMGLCADPVTATAADEQALEAAAAKRKPDPELLALLARSALARGDPTRTAAQASRLAAVEKGPRAALFLARAAVLRQSPDARATLEKLVSAQPDLMAAQLELAALDARAGNLAQASARVQPLTADAVRSRLSPAERSRALAILGSIAGVDPARAADADKLLSDAVAADPRLVEARVRLVQHRLRRGDGAGAVAATDPVAKDAAQIPELAAARVRALAVAGRALDAAQLADQALGRSPARSELLLGKAFALGSAGKPEEARAIYTDVLKRDPDAVEPRVALARFALSAGDPARAAELIGPALVKDPRDAGAHSVNGDVLQARGDGAGAEAAYRKALEIDPAYAPAELGMGRLALARGDAAAARAALSSAAAHEPRNPDILVEYGTLLWKSGELGPAEATFGAALDAAPKHALALTRLGAVLLKKGDADGAVRRLTSASNEAPQLVEARLWLGRALLARSEAQGAIIQLKKAVELSRSAENLLALGSAQEKAGALSEALDSYRAAGTVEPASAEPPERVAVLLAQIGRCDEALEAFGRAIQLAPRVSRLRLGQAECTAKLGKHEQAVKLLQALLKSDPQAVQGYFLMARSLHEWKGMAPALPWYERAAREEPGNAMPHYYLGYAYKEHGQKAKAVQEFRKFLEKKPDAPEKKDIEAEIEDLGGR